MRKVTTKKSYMISEGDVCTNKLGEPINRSFKQLIKMQTCPICGLGKEMDQPICSDCCNCNLTQEDIPGGDQY